MPEFGSGLIVIPACNEARSLKSLLPKLKKVIEGMTGKEVGIIVIDDGSRDDTEKVARSFDCAVHKNEHNLGVGAALRSGFNFAVHAVHNYDFVITIDADGQHDPSFLPRIVQELESGGDVVIASRFHPSSERFSPPLDRDLLNVSVASMIRSCTGWRITDPLSGYWGIRDWVVRFLVQNLRLERYGSRLEGLIKLWYLCDEKPDIHELPHPAIYTGGNGECFLNREYGDDHVENRMGRFGDHARHILETLKDIIRQGKEAEVDDCMSRLRSEQVTS